MQTIFESVVTLLLCISVSSFKVSAYLRNYFKFIFGFLKLLKTKTAINHFTGVYNKDYYLVLR